LTNKQVEMNLRNLGKYLVWHTAEGQPHDFGDVLQLDAWRLSDSSQLRTLLENMLSQVNPLADRTADFRKLETLKKSLGETGMVISQIQETIRYRLSESNERVLLHRSLPVRAVDLQRTLRSQAVKTERDLDELESAINVVKAILAKYGSSKGPSVQGIRDSIVHMTQIATRQRSQVADLTSALADVRLHKRTTTPSKKATLGARPQAVTSPVTPSKAVVVSRESVLSDDSYITRRYRRKFKSEVVDVLRRQAPSKVLESKSPVR
jgi:hypothetical protein